MHARAAAVSTFAPLRQPVFRTLWLAWLGANVTMWMNDVAAAWLMTSLTDSALMVALVQSAAALPVFLLGLPSGALADSVDRRRLLALTQVWVGGVAVVLAVLAYAGALSAPLLLACTCANGIGMAVRWPVFSAIVPDLVRRSDLPSALALNGIAALMARIVGPLAAGALIAGTGGAGVFLCNAALNAAALALILRWPAPARAELSGEHFFPAMRNGLLHVLRAPPLRIVLLRVFLFFFQVTALTALLPLVALRLGGGPAAFTSLLVALAGGAIVVVCNLQRLRRHAGPDTIVAGGICVHAIASVGAGLAPTMWQALPAVAVAGMAWIAAANSLTVAMQLALPDRVRARGMAIYHVAVMGGSAAGGALWGWLAGVASVGGSIVAAAALGSLVFLLTRRCGIGAGA